MEVGFKLQSQLLLVKRSKLMLAVVMMGFTQMVLQGGLMVEVTLVQLVQAVVGLQIFVVELLH
jgi:hypothetical protein